MIHIPGVAGGLRYAAMAALVHVCWFPKVYAVEAMEAPVEAGVWGAWAQLKDQ